MFHARRLAVLAALLALVAGGPVGCGSPDDTVEIQDVRRRPRPRRAVPPGANTVQRFDLARGGDGMPPGHPPAEPTRRWDYELPEGWQELPANPMRELGLRVAGRADTECSVSILQGTGGGLAANVNRWRKQMSLEEIDEQAVAALPQKPLVARSATFVDLTGAYRGMQGEVQIKQARLLGLILMLPNAGLFVKLVGPAEVVAQERGRFEQFTRSLAPARRKPPTPHGGAVASSASKLSWKVPQGWQTRPPRAMREVTIAPPESTGDTECYVALLAGRAGGAKANINRWLAQLGQPGLDDEGFAELRRIPMLGGEGIMVQASGGRFTGQAGEAVRSAMLLGVVLERPSESVFVKMTGPADVVQKHVESFVAFCESLSE